MQRGLKLVLVAVLSLSLSSCKIFSSSSPNTPQSDDITTSPPTDPNNPVAGDPTDPTNPSDPVAGDPTDPTNPSDPGTDDPNNTNTNKPLVMRDFVTPGNLLITGDNMQTVQDLYCIAVKNQSVDVTKITQNSAFSSSCSEACKATYKAIANTKPQSYYAICSKNALSGNTNPSDWELGVWSVVYKCEESGTFFKTGSCHETYKVTRKE